MNNKITLPELVDAIAELTKTSKRVSELFLKELFGVIRERLEQGESIKIKNLGTFKIVEIAARKSVNVNTGEEMEIAAHRRVNFTPDKSLAEAINTPFEGFETIALDDNITNEEIELLSSTTDVNEDTITPPPFSPTEEINNNKIIAESTPIVNKEHIKEDSIVEEKSEQEQKPTDISQQVKDKKTTTTFDNNLTSEEEKEEFIQPQKEEQINEIKTSIINDSTIKYDEDEVAEEKRKSFVGGVILGLTIGALLTVLAWFIVFGNNEASIEQNDETIVAEPTTSTNIETHVETDTPLHTVTIPKKLLQTNIVTDTIKVNYFLTKMSRKYYGRYEFWVYIYEENKSKIENPNSVPPGLVVVIPPAEKYGIDKNNPESVQKAKEIAKKIL